MTDQPIDKARDKISPYNEGYLVAELCGSYFVDGHLQMAPKCPYEIDTQHHRSWFAGLIDNVHDREGQTAR